MNVDVLLILVLFLNQQKFYSDEYAICLEDISKPKCECVVKELTPPIEAKAPREQALVFFQKAMEKCVNK